MNSRILDKLRQDALQLPEAERAELAHDLVESLDEPADADVAAAWDAEILRRLDAVDSGTAVTVDRREFTLQVRERLEKP